MGLLTYIGFEPGTTKGIGQSWHLSGDYAYGVVSGQKHGDGCLKCASSNISHQGYADVYSVDNATNNGRSTEFSTDDDDVFLSFWFKTAKDVVTGFGRTDLRIVSGMTSPWYLALTMTNRYLSLKPSGSSAQTGSTSLQIGTWHLIEVRWQRASAEDEEDGRVRVWLDGELEIDYEGWTYHEAPTYYRFGKSTGSAGDLSGNWEIYFDDVIVSNNKFYSDCTVSSVAVPVDDGNYTAWLGIYTRLQERSDIAYNDPAQYPSDREVNSINRITNSRAGRKESQVFDISDETYGTLTDGPSTGDSIVAIRVDWYSYMDGSAPAATIVKFYPRINGTDYAVATGASLEGDILYPNYSWLSEQNPNTSASWKYSDLTGTNFEAVEDNVSTTGVAARVSAVHLSVLWKEGTAARRKILAHAGL
jgi:hypothetical protein